MKWTTRIAHLPQRSRRLRVTETRPLVQTKKYNHLLQHVSSLMSTQTAMLLQAHQNLHRRSQTLMRSQTMQSENLRVELPDVCMELAACQKLHLPR